MRRRSGGRPAARQLAGQELLARLHHVMVEPERAPDHLAAQAVDAERVRRQVAAVGLHRPPGRRQAEGVRVAARLGAGGGAQDRLEMVVGRERAPARRAARNARSPAPARPRAGPTSRRAPSSPPGPRRPGRRRAGRRAPGSASRKPPARPAGSAGRRNSSASMKAIQSASWRCAARIAAVGGELRPLAGPVGEGQVPHQPRGVERREQRAAAVARAVVGDEEARHPEHPVIGDPFQEVRGLVLDDGADGEAGQGQGAGSPSGPPPDYRPAGARAISAGAGSRRGAAP